MHNDTHTQNIPSLIYSPNVLHFHHTSVALYGIYWILSLQKFGMSTPVKRQMDEWCVRLCMFRVHIDAYHAPNSITIFDATTKLCYRVGVTANDIVDTSKSSEKWTFSYGKVHLTARRERKKSRVQQVERLSMHLAPNRAEKTYICRMAARAVILKWP